MKRIDGWLNSYNADDSEINDNDDKTGISGHGIRNGNRNAQAIQSFLVTKLTRMMPQCYLTCTIAPAPSR